MSICDILLNFAILTMEKLKYDKPHKTYKQQLKHLEDKYGLIVDYSKDIHMLKSHSYYDLINGTKECFMKNGRYAAGTTLKHLVLFRIIDISFQNILFKYSLHAETKFKNILANTIAQDIGVHQDEYLDESKYKKHKTKNSRKTFSELREAFQRTYPSYPTKHYLDTKNHIPPWILFKNVSFSTLIDLTFFLPNKVRNDVADQLYQTKVEGINYSEYIATNLTIIRKFRNIFAHNYKFIHSNSGKHKLHKTLIMKHFCPHIVKTEELKLTSAWNTPYSMVLALFLVNDSRITRLMIEDIESIIRQHSGSDFDEEIMTLYFDTIHFPEDFLARLISYIY